MVSHAIDIQKQVGISKFMYNKVDLKPKLEETEEDFPSTTLAHPIL